MEIDKSKILHLPINDGEITPQRKVLGENNKDDELSLPKIKDTFKVRLKNEAGKTSLKFQRLGCDSTYSKDIGDEKENVRAPLTKTARYTPDKAKTLAKEVLHQSNRDTGKYLRQNDYSQNRELKKNRSSNGQDIMDIKKITQKDIKTSTSSQKPNNQVIGNMDPLSPELKDMILKQKSKKIRRPPNAFMLFAKEMRRQIQSENSDLSNKVVSICLGQMWRELPSEEVTKYFQQAKALQKLHKETFPDYNYSPIVARKDKETKNMRKKISENSTSNKSRKSLNFNATDDAKKDENYKGKENASFKGQFSPYSNSMYDHQFYPQPNTSHIPSRESCCNPFCIQQIHNCKNYYSSNMNQCHATPEDFGPPTVTSTSNPCNCSSMLAHPFYPSYWRPWMMWSSSGCCLPFSRPMPKPFLNHWMQPSAFPAANSRPLSDVYQDRQQEKGLRNIIHITPHKEGTIQLSAIPSTNQCTTRNDGEEDDKENFIVPNNDADDSDDEPKLVIVDNASDEEISVDD